jgi:hypothetical protein
VNTLPPAAGATRCTRCGAPFTCGRDDPNGCWCAALPPLPAHAVAAGADCLCPNCLRAALAAASVPA